MGQMQEREKINPVYLKRNFYSTWMHNFHFNPVDFNERIFTPPIFLDNLTVFACVKLWGVEMARN